MAGMLDESILNAPLHSGLEQAAAMAVSWLAVAALATTVLGATIVSAEKQPLENSTCGRVWLTVHSPEIKRANDKNLVDALELNWDFNSCLNIPMKIGLFPARPKDWNNALSVYDIDTNEGYLVTNVSLGDPTLPGWETGPGPKGPQCIWPWVGAGDDKIVAYNCLKIQPTWMEDNHAKIKLLPIGELVIPGTHNAGAWKFNTDLSSTARDSFILCQDRSIWAQLVHGIRYFDFRISYYGFYDGDDRYWLNHNLIRIRPLVPLLREIRTFLDNTKEIVLLDAHLFPLGFYETDGTLIKNVHLGLLDLIQRELGPHLAPAKEFHLIGSKGPQVQMLVDVDKRLLFSYAENAIVSEHDWLWPGVPQLWANTNKPEELFKYLDRTLASSPDLKNQSPLYSAMAQTTPTMFDIFLLPGSLRENADAVNRKVTARLYSRWRKDANIVSTDFFLGNDVIDISIMICDERGQKLQ